MKAFLFPGQGSQSPGMGQFLYENFSTARLAFEEASDSVQLDLKKLCFESAPEVLSLTENTQPALLCVSTATARVLMQDFGIKPEITAGHSIGEYASLVLAESLAFSDAMKSVRLRGQAMQSAVPVGEGGMTAALGLSEEQVKFLCRWAMENSKSGPISPANYNCDGQIVISGRQETLDWLRAHFKPEVLPTEAKRAKLIPLQVSAPFHCELMKPAQEKMENYLNQIRFQDAKIPVIQNVNASLVTQAQELKKNLVEQVSAPVLWTQSMQRLKSRGYSDCIECGNGSVLKGLLKKIDGEFFKVQGVNSMDDLKSIEALLKS